MARRRKHKRATNKYAQHHEPEAELDFHDRGSLTDQAIHRETLRFVASARKQGQRRVRIVVGKGLHSAAGPRAGPQVRRTLRRLERDGEIRGFRNERVDAGGAGAIRVDL